MVDITHALERVARVPGALRRRALMVGREDRAMQPPSLPAAQRPLAAVVGDASLLVHDALAAAAVGRDKAGPKSRDTEVLALAVRLHAARAETLVDAFGTAAALRDVRLLHVLFEKGLDVVAEQLDYAALIYDAAMSGDQETVAWLWALTTNADLRILKMQALRRIEPIRKALEVGARRALDALDGKRDEGMIQHIRGLLGLDGTLPTTTEELATAMVPATTQEPALSHITTKQLVVDVSPASPTTAAMLVLAMRSLMRVIGTFQEDPLVLVKPLMTTMHVGVEVLPPHAAAAFAIIQGDLFTFKAACLLSKVRPSDLPLLLHFAACEGHLDMVKWLHSQFPEDIKCRPDTMAMVVRCGWAEIVEWLYLNCPESARTLSCDAWNDAARWGHVDVLRVCHKYSLAESAPGVLTHAIGGDHLQIVQLLHSLEWGYDRDLAMREALSYGQLQIVRWLHTEEAVSTGRLAEALCSSAPSAEDTVGYMWSLIDSRSELVVSCVIHNFRSICEKAASTTIATVLPLVEPESEAAYEGLLAATQAARLDNVQLLLPHWSARTAERLDSLLMMAQVTGDANLSTWLIEQTCFELANLNCLFERLCERQKAFLEAQVVKSTKGIEVDPLVVSLMKAIHKRRQQERKRDGAAATARNEGGFEVERALLTSVSERTQQRLVTVLIDCYRQPRLGESESNAVIKSADGIMLFKFASGAVDAAASAGEPVFRFVSHTASGTLKSPFCAFHAARTGNLDVLRFLLQHGLLPTFMIEVVVATAYANCQTSVLQWLGEQGAVIASEPGLWAAMDKDHMAIVGFAIDRHDAAIDETLHKVLLDKAHEETGKADAGGYARRNESAVRGSWKLGWGMSLLQLAMQKRPDQHQRLLETAAESGVEQAIKFVLGPRSGFDVATMQLSGALVAAARGKNEAIMKMLYENKQASDQIEIAALRKLAGLCDVDAVETLLTKLCEWDAGVRQQMEEERASASVFLPPTGSNGSSSILPREKPRHRSSRPQRPRPGKRASR